jgi:anti-sigma factor RsiW
VTERTFHPESGQLQDFIEGSLDKPSAAVLESHVLGCAYCQKEVADLRSVFTALARMERFSPGLGFANRVMAQVKLPEPWYARAGRYAAGFAPRTTRGWAFASGLLALPLIGMGTLMLWVLSKPYVTGEGLIAFALKQTGTSLAVFGRNALSTIIQSDITLLLTRLAESVLSAGLAGAGAVVASFAGMIALSAWILYQNLIRTPTRRSNYASYSF